MINQNLLQRFFSPAFIQRGTDYFQRGRVEFVRRKQNGAIAAIVRGSTLYQVRISLGPNSIHGECTCPVEFNCKHVVAALLELDAQQEPIAGHANTLQPVVEEDNVVETWTGHLQRAIESENTPEVARKPSGNRQLLYLLQPVDFQQRYTILLRTAYLKKDGSFSQVNSFDPQNTLFGNPPKLVQPEDTRLLRRLYLQGRVSSDLYQLDGEGGSQLLEDLVSTGRCHWKESSGPQLCIDKPVSSSLVWKANSQGEQKLMLEVPEHHGNILLMLDRVHYLDPTTGIIGEVISDYSSSLISKLYHLPAIPPKEVQALSKALKKDPELSFVPRPQKIAPPKTRKVKPIPVLTLLVGEILAEEEDLPWYRESALQSMPLPMAKIEFEYNGERVGLFSEESTLWQNSGNQCLKIPRQPRQEEKRLNDLSRYLVPTMLFEELAADAGDYFEIPSEYADHFTFPDMQDGGLEFSLNLLPTLEQKGWKVEVDDDWPWHFASEPEQWLAEVEEEGNEWFTLGFDIELEGKQIPLLPLLMEAIRQLPNEATVAQLANLEDQHLLPLPLEDGRLLPVPLGKVRPILQTLIELYDDHELDESGHLRFNRLEAARLAELESAREAADLRWFGGERIRELGRKLYDFNGIETVAPPQQFNASLRDYQQQGLNWLQFLQQIGFGGILADDMGLGKTVQTLAHLLLQKQQGGMESPHLVIAPTSLMVNWRAEAARFAPDLKVIVLHGPERKKLFDQIPESDLVLTTYPLLSRDAEKLLAHRYNTLVLDEAQVIKNPRARATQIVHQLNATHRLCLSGTPMENHLGELWSLMHFLNPGLLGDERLFRQRFRNPIEKQGNMDRQQQLQRRIAPFLLRRTKQEVVAELPQKSEIIRAVELEGEQRKLYETIRLAMHEKVRQAVEKKGINRSHIIILDALLKLRQVCCDPRLLKLDSAKKVKHSAKLDMLMAFLPEMIEEGRRILLFSQFTSMISLIEEVLKKKKIDYVKLTGNTRDRATPVERFQAGEVPLFLISLKAGGTGLNLTAADTVIHYDPWWNPAVENQATDRAYRIGQDKPVFVYKFITANTVEERILEMQQKKQALADGLYGRERAQDGATFNADDLQALFDPLDA